MRSGVPLLLVLPLLSGCTLLGGETVTRKVHGRLEEGRFVSETAYLSYTEGALAESRRELDVAERAYLQAASLDDESADVWTRVGAVRCARGDRVRADEAFARALRIDGEWAPAFAERATCALAGGDIAKARADARRALTLDPSPESSTLLVAQIEVRAGETEEAKRWLRGLIARAPWRAERLQRDMETSPPPATPRPSSVSSRALVDAALARGDGVEARRLSMAAHVSPGALAIRAAALGAFELARDHATLVLGADPPNAEARIALLVASDALGDPTGRAQATSDVPSRTSSPPELATLLLAELLERHAFPDAAASLRKRARRDPGDDDPLLQRMRARASAAQP